MTHKIKQIVVREKCVIEPMNNFNMLANRLKTVKLVCAVQNTKISTQRNCDESIDSN